MAAHRPGVALILVLLAAAALFPLAIAGGTAMRSATIEARAIRTSAADRHAAHSAASLALNAIVTGIPGQVIGGEDGSATADPGSEDPDDLTEMPAILRSLIGDLLDEAEEDADPNLPPPTRQTRGSTGSTRSLRADLPLDPIRVTLEGVDWHVRVRDLTTLLPINHAPGAQLRRYFELIGVDPAVLDALVDQVLDWRDEDEFVRPFGLESAGYRAAGVAPRNGHFQSPRELLYLPAMTPELYRLIEPHVTAGGDGTVNALLAPDALLASLPGVDDALAERLLDLRRRGELDQDAARSVLAAADEAFDLLRFTPSSVVRIEVAPADGERAEYHGWAAVTPSAVRGPFLEPAGVTGVPKAR